MKLIASSMSAKGQTTIPVEIRKLLNLSEGDLIHYEVDDDHSFVKIQKIKRVDMQWAKALESSLTEWSGKEDDDL